MGEEKTILLAFMFSAMLFCGAIYIKCTLDFRRITKELEDMGIDLDD